MLKYVKMQLPFPTIGIHSEVQLYRSNSTMPNRYFSAAPLSTAAHIELLSALEAVANGS
jgi:hypothetical protein